MHLSRNRLVAIFLAVFVLFAQHGASLHALSHAVEDVAQSSKVGQDRQAPSGHENCEQCLSFAAVGAGLLGSQAVVLAAFTHEPGSPLRVAHVVRRTTTVYHSRAPPLHFV